MRLFFITLLAVLTFNIEANAQETIEAPTINQGAGLLYSDLDGALPKGLWWKQHRSDIIYLLQNLPASAPSRAVQEIKRNMLVSYYNTSVIANDIKRQDGTGLLSVRLQKLMEMGFWDDAFKLYTDNIKDPGNISTLAEIGVMIIMNVQGVSTACLEEKVLYPRFSPLPFWQKLDMVCSIELGMLAATDANFEESPVLQAIYMEPEFRISANDIERLSALNNLELSILRHKKKIDYQGFNPTSSTPPAITKLFLEDENLNERRKTDLTKIAIKQALKPLPALTPAQKDALEDTNTLGQRDALRLSHDILRLGQKAPLNLANRLYELAENYPENYFYLGIINHIDGNYGNNIIDEDKFNLGAQALVEKYENKVILLQNALDKTPLFSNNPDTIYEKRAKLTSDNTYVISEASSKQQEMDWLQATLTHRMPGLSLLLVLSNIENNANGEGSLNPIKSLSTVGLINQAHHLTREKLAELIEATL